MKRSISFLIAAAIALLMVFPVQVQAASSLAGIVQISGGSLNVRSSPSTGGQILSSLRKGSYVILLERSGSWWKVEYGKGMTGYCHGDYISTLSGSESRVSINSGTLNVRSGAGTSYSKVGSLRLGERVVVLSQSNGWSKILYHGTRIGYVSSQYLSSEDSSGGISLKVPSFKQTDSRWANTYIGSSGKTMAKIGCATTAIAMMESYRTGSTIYPDAMAKKLNYTSGGNVYWPDHYKSVASSTNLLAGIRSLLRQGKPVLFGGKNSQGSQHWVVITGFSGDGSSASQYLIQDPGSSSRVNLQQFLNYYPVFYKYFHY